MKFSVEQSNTLAVDAANGRLFVRFYCQWIEWFRRSEYKWYNFDFIVLKFENSHRWGGYFDLEAGLLGFVFLLTYYPKWTAE